MPRHDFVGKKIGQSNRMLPMCWADIVDMSATDTNVSHLGGVADRQKSRLYQPRTWMSVASRLRQEIRLLVSVCPGNAVILREHTTKRESSTSWWQSVLIETTTWNGTIIGCKKRVGQKKFGCIHSMRESLISLQLIGRAAHSVLWWIISTYITALFFCRWLPVEDTGTFSEHHTGPWMDRWSTYSIKSILFCCSTSAPLAIWLFWVTASKRWLLRWQTLRITFFMYDCLTMDNIL